MCESPTGFAAEVCPLETSRDTALVHLFLAHEVEYKKSPIPTTTVRERIAEDIKMTERSVQIWFQNRYVL